MGKEGEQKRQPATRWTHAALSRELGPHGLAVVVPLVVAVSLVLAVPLVVVTVLGKALRRLGAPGWLVVAVDRVQALVGVQPLRALVLPSNLVAFRAIASAIGQAHVPLVRLKHKGLVVERIAGLEGVEGTFVGSVALSQLTAAHAKGHSPGAAPGETDVVVVFFHGGGFCGGHNAQALDALAAWAQAIRDHSHSHSHSNHRTRHVGVLTVSYPLAPEHPHPAAVHHGKRVFQTIARALPPSPSLSLVLAGDSAGGCLALTTALQAAQDSACPRPTALVLLSPWATQTQTQAQAAASCSRRDMLSAAWLRSLSGLYLQGGQTNRDHPLASPLRSRHLATLPRTLLVWGGAEVLAGSCVELLDAMRAAGVDVAPLTHPHMPHEFPLFPLLYGPPAREALVAMARFCAALP